MWTGVNRISKLKGIFKINKMFTASQLVIVEEGSSKEGAQQNDKEYSVDLKKYFYF